MSTWGQGLSRRRFLALAALSMGGGGIAWPGSARAMGRLTIAQGVRELKGDVLINGSPAAVGTIVRPGDVVVTRADSRVVFVMGQSVFLMRDHTRLDIAETMLREDGHPTAALLTLIRGKLLSVFGNGGDRRLVTTTAVLGVRGTGLYVEAEPGGTYACTCYGQVVITAFAHGRTETVTTQYHDAPRYIYGPGAIRAIAVAPVYKHSDAELIHLEALVGRKPPFLGENYQGHY